jgi:hypothetical protein
MPSPADLPQHRPDRPPQSNLERVFGFSDPHFNTFITLRQSTGLSAETLLEHSEAMAGHDNPIVKYAGGWAAAEVAMRRGGRLPISTRLAALERADATWSSAGAAFAAIRHHSYVRRLQAEYLGYELRATQGLAYIPTMTVVAELLAGAKVDNSAIEAKIQPTQKNLLELGKLSRDQSDQIPPNIIGTRRGFLAEVLTGLLMQSDRPLNLLILPASIRQVHHYRNELRADLVAMRLPSPTSTDRQYPRKLIQVTGDPSKAGMSHHASRVIVHTHTDLYDEHRTPADIFDAFAEREAGTLQDPDVDARLDVLARVITRRVTA